MKKRLSANLVLSWAIFIAIIFSIVNAALPRLEMLLFDGHVPVPSVSIKFFIFTAMLLYLLNHARLKVKLSSVFILLCFISYIIIDVLLVSSSGDYSAATLVFGYNSMYSYLVMVLLLIIFSPEIPERSISKTLFFLSIILVAIGTVQTVTNNPLFPLRSVDGYFQVLVWYYYGQVRAFSLFEAPAYYATFLIFVGAIVLAKMFLSAKIASKLIYAISYIAIFLLEVLTLNRTAMVAYFFVSIIIFGIVKYGFEKPHLKLIMVSSLLFSAALVFSVPLISNLFPFVFEFKDQSVLARISEWQYWIHFVLLDTSRIIWGSGVFQNSILISSRDVIIDNMFLAVLVQAGIVGLIFVIYVIYYIWSTLVDRYLHAQNPIAMAVISLITVWPIFAVFGTGLNIFPIYAAIPFFLKPKMFSSVNPPDFEMVSEHCYYSEKEKMKSP